MTAQKGGEEKDSLKGALKEEMTFFEDPKLAKEGATKQKNQRAESREQ